MKQGKTAEPRGCQIRVKVGTKGVNSGIKSNKEPSEATTKKWNQIKQGSEMEPRVKRWNKGCKVEPKGVLRQVVPSHPAGTERPLPSRLQSS